MNTEQETNNTTTDEAQDYFVKINNGLCPVCGASLHFGCGCKFCPECHWTACDN